ncbi:MULTISPECIES: hypothetical protein [Streptosporangium]|uniref:Hydantoinase A/oxoprolinase domain-containing protein n=1 Tax=Streptosporangium brasiliense TaxID=47480 RepID=A0ABT9RM83_9ACTN|nr:hypothetical protein [Streptosporangium brasiliense]MDP9869931.1 hypothetical protein [Streptosporangium brasiliense]
MILGVDLGGHAPVVAAVRDGALTEPVGAARAVSVAVDLDTVRRAGVAAIRVAGPCPPGLGPLVGWPPDSGTATVVRGGHSLTGRPIAELDAGAVARFAAGCGLTDFAVTATGSPVVADHELAVAEIITAEVPGARITLSYEFGRAGLRERENSAILNAALGPEADRIADRITGRMARDFPGTPLLFARTGTGLVSAPYFRRYPLVCYLGAFTCALRGGAALAGLADTVVQERGTRVRTGLVAGGVPRTGGRRDTGVPVNVPLPMSVQAPGGVAVGPRAREAGPGWQVPERAELAVAYGAALAGPTAEVERIVHARGRAELDRAIDDARDEALTRVVSAGAAPGSARVATTVVNPLSYLPDGLYRVQVKAEGAPP